MGNCLKKSRPIKGENQADAAFEKPEINNFQEMKHTTNNTNQSKAKAPKSWETRPKLNKEDYQFKNRENEILLKKPGQINGQQFLLENCKNCKVMLCDYIATIFVDDCENCQIFIGPCSSSVFIRNSSNLKVILACQQYRISESHNISSLIFCMTQPTLEKASDLKFGCFKFGYFSLREQFDKAGLNIWNNSWFEVFDFSKGENKNFSFFPKGTEPNEIIDFAGIEDLHEIGVFSTKEDLEKNCVVPLTCGVRKQDEEETLMFIHPEKTSLIEQMIFNFNSSEGIDLIKTKAIKLNKTHLEQLFTNKVNINLEEIQNSKKESVFLLFSGKDCGQICDLISKSCGQGFFHIWSQKDSIKKCSSLVFESWKNENPILK